MSDAFPEPGSVGVVATQIARVALPPEGLRLEGGETLPELQVAYETYGQLSPKGDNVIFICPTLTSDAHAAGYHGPERDTRGWWDEMIGPGKGIDTSHYFVVCANILGGCKGTTGPSSADPRTGRPYGSKFPRITIGDMVTVHGLLMRHLGVRRLAAVIGGSLGGMQALEWTIREPDLIDRCVCIASASSLSAQALAFDIVGRSAITSDPNWHGGDYYGTGFTPVSGLSQARKIGHITYLSPTMMDKKFGRDRREALAAEMSALFRSTFEVESYLDHQGKKFVERFDANSYLHITTAMDEFDLAERYGSVEQAFAPVKAKLLVVALSADWLFPAEQSVELANALQRAGKRVSYCLLHAPHGHDAFLVDIEHLSEVIRAFLPWVNDQGGPSPAGRGATAEARQTEYSIILDMVQPRSRVLDLGCGDGELLSVLAEHRGVTGVGVDIDIRHAIAVIDRGHDLFQGDIDAGLAGVPDGAYDYAILSETLQVVRQPRLVLRELLRVAREGIVSFPNFGYWLHRVSLLAGGRMPKSSGLPFEWYETPNIHLFTLRDFIGLCDEDGITVQDVVCIPDGRLSRWLVSAGLCNLGAERVLVKVTRRGPGQAGRRPACRCPCGMLKREPYRVAQAQQTAGKSPS